MGQGVAPGGLARFLPIVGWLPGYPARWLRFDLMAGLTAAAVVIPQAMAYAAIAGLPVQVGLYTALVPMLAYALLGASRTLSVSTTSTIAMLTATALATVAPSSNPLHYMVPAATLAFLTGVFLLLAAILRLGFLANFISLPVLTGFKAGVGVLILVGQLGKVLGIPVPKGPFFPTILALGRGLGEIHWLTLMVALGTLAILLFLPRRTSRLPAPLVAVAAAILASALFQLGARGMALVGPVPPGLPAFEPPDLSLVRGLWPGALGIALMSFTESIAAARTFAKHGDPPCDPNQELLALGTANLGGSFFQAMPAGGGTSQTAVNSKAGARTQLAAIATAGVVIVTLLFLAPVVSLMPEATLGALVLVAAAGLIKVQEFRAIAGIRRIEFWLAIIAFAGVLLLGTLEGILLAVAHLGAQSVLPGQSPPGLRAGAQAGHGCLSPAVAGASR